MVHQIGRTGAAWVVGVDAYLADTNYLIHRAARGPEIDRPVPLLTEGPHGVAGVLLSNAIAQLLKFFPGGRDSVTELIHQLLIIIEDVLGDIITQTVEFAVKPARSKGIAEAFNDVIRDHIFH